MQPCLCLSDRACLDREKSGVGVLRRPIIILHTSWRPVGAGQTSLLFILHFSTVAQLRAVYPPALCRCGRQALREQVISLSAWFMGQLPLPLYFMAELVGLKLSSNLSSPFPRILWGYWTLWSLTVCTCAFAALCFALLILTRRRFVSSEQAGAPCLSRFMWPAFSENPFPVKSLTPLAVLLLNNCQMCFDDRV